MTFLNYFAMPSETEQEAFERLIEKYKPLILKTVKRKSDQYAGYLYSRDDDRDDLMQIARFAFWEANDRFDLGKINGKVTNPEYVFAGYAAVTMAGRLNDYLRKHYRHAGSECFSDDGTPDSYAIPDEPVEPPHRQMLRHLETHLPRLSPREVQYLKLALFQDWDTRRIATEAGVSVNTVDSWKKSLRKKLQPLKDELLNNRQDS